MAKTAAGSNRHGIDVAVSPSMRRFRDAQTELNAMLWSTEICYGHVLGSTINARSDVWSLFSHAPSHAWFPNREGQAKYNKPIPEFLSDVRKNARLLHRHILISFYSQFEAYLKERLGEDCARGPFVMNLAIAPLLEAPYRPRPGTVLLADLSRLIRNRIVHHGSLPRAPGDGPILQMCASFDYPKNKSLQQKMTDALGRWGIDPVAIGSCFDSFVESVSSKCKGSSRGSGPLTHEFFYTLFTFTHLDNLAFEIEEALFDPAMATAVLTRAPGRVRNRDMAGRTAPFV